MDTLEKVELPVELEVEYKPAVIYNPLALSAKQKACLVARRAVEILQNPARWTKRAFAKTSTGRSTHPESRYAYSYCLVGSLQRASHELGFDTAYFGVSISDLVELKMLDIVRSNYKAQSIPSLNDAPGTTHDTVMNVATLTAQALCTDLPGDECTEV